MKLSKVTQEDAIRILQIEYAFFKTGRWVLTDETEAIKEPCKKLSCPRKAYVFWFFDNKMDVDLIDDEAPITLDDTNYDVKHECYVKAHELGYHIPAFDKLTRPTLNLEEIEKLVQAYLDKVPIQLKTKIDAAKIIRDKIGYNLNDVEQFKNGKG